MTGSFHKWLMFGLVFVVLLLPQGESSGQRLCCQGDDWLHSNRVKREILVSSYMRGYLDGLEAGCKTGIPNSSGNSESTYETERLRKCWMETVNYSAGTTHFISEITTFYERYPQDRDIAPEEILEKLGRGLTLSDIHDYPFPRHKRSDKDPT